MPMPSKQREALLAVYDCAKDGVLSIRESAFEKVLEALKEPLRNCDRFNSGDVKKDAQDAMEAILAEGVAGYRGIAEYLLSPAAEQQPELPRPATDEEVAAGDAQWCKACRTECMLRGRDILVHDCARHNPDKALS